MKNLASVVASFVLGAICMFFMGNHTSIFVRTASAQVNNSPSIPIVPPIRSIVVNHQTQIGGEYLLDGIHTENSNFDNVTFVYGGGAYDLKGSRLAIKELKFIGAAANTVQLLAELGLLQGSQPPAGTNTPIEKTPTKTTIHGDFVSPYNGL